MSISLLETNTSSEENVAGTSRDITEDADDSQYSDNIEDEVC